MLRTKLACYNNITMIADKLVKIHDYLWEIPQSFRADMRVPARFYASGELIKEISSDRSLEQLVNVTTLPGIFRYSLAMPDIHEGYGFPVGGVAAIRTEEGIISPGGIGYDINCGVRLLATPFSEQEVRPRLKEIADGLNRAIPSGLGGGGIKFSLPDLDGVLNQGVRFLVKKGLAPEKDLDFIESGGALPGADATKVSERAKKRGQDQLGTMGAGNHFVEVDVVEKVLFNEAAEKFGLRPKQVVTLIHSGSRGLGHQVATDYLKIMIGKAASYPFVLPDRELVSAPFSSGEGQDYFGAMQAAANFAWSNRQIISQSLRRVFKELMGKDAELTLIYDVAHNIAKLEEYKGEKLLIHRKGATRAFGPGHSEITEKYRAIGQPVIIPGSMGTYSYILVGTEKAGPEAFGSSCHGAGRRMSRTRARKLVDGGELKHQLNSQGIEVRAGSIRGLAEEAPFAYKDIDSIVKVVEEAGIAKRVVRLKPIAVIKG